MTTYTVRCLAEVEADTVEEALEQVREQCVKAEIYMIYFPATIREKETP